MYYIALLFILLPTGLFAYLDPGSGAVLINLFITAAAALIYSFKGIFLRVLGGKKTPKTAVPRLKLAIFSEGSAYRLSFQPLFEELIRQKQHFAYYTLDIEDPLLQINNQYCHSRFLGFGALGKYRAGRLPEATLISTTPNIGCPGYPVKRSPFTRHLVHIFHSLIDVSLYKKGSLDHYDAVIMPGDFHESPIRHLEILRGLKAKELISLGAPYLDYQVQEKQESTVAQRENCILIASSWGDKGLLKHYGLQPFFPLTQAGWQLIIRPHPHSLSHEKALIESLQNQTRNIPDITWDFALSGVKSMQKAALMISDTSSIRFDFAFLYEKPVLTLPIDAPQMPGFERDDLDEIWSDRAASEIGSVLKKDEVLHQLEAAVKRTLKDYDAALIRRFRDANVSNFGKATPAIVDYLKPKIQC